MRVSFDSLAITVAGERADDHPKIFTRMRVSYHFQGKSIPPEKVAQAIKLADEVYCSAANMMKVLSLFQIKFLPAARSGSLFYCYFIPLAGNTSLV